MSIVLFLLQFVEVACALVLILLVLLQRSRDEGLGMAFGNSMGESLFGAQATTILTKGTVIIAVVFMVNTLVLGKLSIRGGAADSSTDIMNKLAIPTAPAIPIENAPAPVAEEAVPAAPVQEMPVAAPVPAPSAPAEAAPAPVPAT
jgi:preprotein translocase subunit SecG